MIKNLKLNIKKMVVAVAAVCTLFTGGFNANASSTDNDDLKGYFEGNEYPTGDYKDADGNYIEFIDNEELNVDESALINQPIGPVSYIDMTRNLVSINWTISAGSSATSVVFKAKSGGTISVAVTVSPTNAIVRVGIVQPNGVMLCVQGSGSVGNTFNLTQSGYYRVYVSNLSSSTVYVAGAYSY